MLPGPYERWFHELSGRASPVETRSTCDACAMSPGAPDLPPEGPFDAALKCCTYHPHLAPHFVGGILASGSDAGRARVRARIAARVGVSPLGLGPTPATAALHQREQLRAGGFGRNVALACPFHDAGRCTIWAHRGAACASFHCKYDRGVAGAALWNLLTIGFNVVERALARWLLARQGLDATACDALLHAPDDAERDAAAWGAWRGREEDYFVAAARSIEALSWDEVVALGGRDLAGLTEALRAAVAERALPERVRPSGEVLHHIGRDGNVRLQHRAVPLDLLTVPAEVVERIKTAAVALADLGLDEALARRLLDWRVLIE